MLPQERDWTAFDMPNPPAVNGNQDMGPWFGWAGDMFYLMYSTLTNVRDNGCGELPAVKGRLTALEDNSKLLQRTAKVWHSWRDTGRRIAWVLVGLFALVGAINEIRELFAK